MEMYNAENQKLRSELKRSKKMRELAGQMWKIARTSEEGMNKEAFEVRTSWGAPAVAVALSSRARSCPPSTNLSPPPPLPQIMTSNYA